MSTSTYLGYVLFTDRDNWRDEKTSDFSIVKQRLDNRVGLFTEDRHAASVREARNYDVFLEGRAEIAAFTAQLAEQKGRLVPFWLATWRHDLTLASQALITTTSLNVKACNYTKFGFGTGVNNARRHLMIRKGTSAHYCGIQAAVDNENGTETLTINDPLPFELQPGDHQLSFLQLVRLNDDAPVVRYHNQILAEVQVTVVDLPTETPEPA